jgi:hypothetical protein
VTAALNDANRHTLKLTNHFLSLKSIDETDPGFFMSQQKVLEALSARGGLELSGASCEAIYLRGLNRSHRGARKSARPGKTITVMDRR